MVAGEGQMKRDIFRMFGQVFGMCAGLLAVTPAVPALAQAGAAQADATQAGAPAAFADGVKAIMSLDYDAMSRANITKGTSWPLAMTYQVWLYDAKRYKGDVYLYPGNDAGAPFSLNYSEVDVQQAHHFLVQLLTTRAPAPEGDGCLPIRDLRRYAATAGWSDIQVYQSMLTHGFTAQKGKMFVNARVDVGKGRTAAVIPALDDEGCVGAVVIKDVAVAPAK
jgi:hypothetical protein